MIRAAILAPTPGSVSSSAVVAVLRLTVTAGLAGRDSARGCAVCARSGCAARETNRAHIDKTIRNIVPPMCQRTLTPAPRRVGGAGPAMSVLAGQGRRDVQQPEGQAIANDRVGVTR